MLLHALGIPLGGHVAAPARACLLRHGHGDGVFLHVPLRLCIHLAACCQEGRKVSSVKSCRFFDGGASRPCRGRQIRQRGGAPPTANHRTCIGGALPRRRYVPLARAGGIIVPVCPTPEPLQRIRTRPLFSRFCTGLRLGRGRRWRGRRRRGDRDVAGSGVNHRALRGLVPGNQGYLVRARPVFAPS